MVIVLLGFWEGSLEGGWPVSFTNVSFTDVSITDVSITEVSFTNISFTNVSFTKVVDHRAFTVASSSAGSSSIHCLFEWVNVLIFTWLSEA